MEARNAQKPTSSTDRAATRYQQNERNQRRECKQSRERWVDNAESITAIQEVDYSVNLG